MTKQDFELIATALREGVLAARCYREEQSALTAAAKAMALTLARTNERFDSARFVEAVVGAKQTKQR